MVANSKLPMFSSSKLALLSLLSVSMMVSMTSGSVHQQLHMPQTILEHQKYVKTPMTHRVKETVNFTLNINQTEE